MRTRLFISGVLGAAWFATAAAANVSLLPGAYASLTTRDAAACARACAEDGICMAWSFDRESRCELSAVVPAEAPASIASGLSARAPETLQMRTPIVHAPAASEAAAAPAAPLSEPAASHRADASGLLGGPGDGDLRLGLR